MFPGEDKSRNYEKLRRPLYVVFGISSTTNSPAVIIITIMHGYLPHLPSLSLSSLFGAGRGFADVGYSSRGARGGLANAAKNAVFFISSSSNDQILI